MALLEAMAEILVDSKQAMVVSCVYVCVHVCVHVCVCVCVCECAHAQASKMTELSQFLSVSAPFGTPLDLQPFNVRTQLAPSKLKSVSDQQKVSHSM